MIVVITGDVAIYLSIPVSSARAIPTGYRRQLGCAAPKETYACEIECIIHVYT